MGKDIGRFLILASGDERTYRCLHPYSQSNLLPYSQAAGPPYCSLPGMGVCKPASGKLAARYRQMVAAVDETAQAIPTVSPLTLRYGTMRLLRCASGVACAGQWPWVPARTFDVIVLTEQRYALTPLPASLSRRQSMRPKPCRSKVLLAYWLWAGACPTVVSVGVRSGSYVHPTFIALCSKW